jgi:hypothetical protein
MGSGGKGPYKGVGGGKAAHSASRMHASVTSWAHKMQNELKGNRKKRFNTACVVVDAKTGKKYYGRNRGIEENGTKKNKALFSESGILPKTSLNKYSVGNCAEVDAVNNALNAGAKLEDLQLMTIHVTKSSFGDLKPACKNCTYAFKGRVKGNYSGWTGQE